MTDLLTPTLAALQTRLANDAGLQTWLGAPARVYDLRPAMATFPYITIGPVELRPADTKNVQMQNFLVTVQIFSRQVTGAECHALLSQLRGCLHDASFAITGAALVRCQEEFASVFTDAKSETAQGLARYRLVVSA